jgi:hypothetical protein
MGIEKKKKKDDQVRTVHVPWRENIGKWHICRWAEIERHTERGPGPDRVQAVVVRKIDVAVIHVNG